jgi:hypothetical protein
MRGYESCVESMFRNLIDLNDIDIFISTESSDKCNENIEANDLHQNYRNKIISVSIMNDSIFQKFKTFLNEKLNIMYDTMDHNYCLDIKTFAEFQQKYLLNIMGRNMYKQLQNKNGFNYSERELMEYIHFQICIDLVKKSKVKYDYVIYYRTDLHISSPIEVETLDLSNEKMFYLNNYFMIFDFQYLFKFDNFMDRILQRPQTDINESLFKKWYLLKESQLTGFLFKNFNVLENLYQVGHVRYDEKNTPIVLHYKSPKIDFDITKEPSVVFDENGVRLYNDSKK